MSNSLSPGRRVVVAALGDDPASSIETNLALEPMEAPSTATLGPHDVVVRVRSAAVGWVDLLMTSGQYQHVPTPPYTPGLEYAGDVAWVGTEVTRVRVGEAVLVDGFSAGPRSLGAYRGWGGFATWAVAPESAVLAIPGSLDHDEACNLLGNYETAYHCLVARGRVGAGDTVLVHGAAGSTGLAAVHVCKLLGARVIATGRSAEKLEVVRREGADHVLCIGDPLPPSGVRRFRDDVKELTGGKGVDVVFDGVGGEVSLESLRCVAFGARYLIVGWAATPLVARGRGERGAPNANVLPTNLIMMKGLDVLGCPTVITTVVRPELRAPRLAQVLEWAASGAIRPHVSARYPLEAFREALRAKWRGQFVGGAVIHP